MSSSTPTVEASLARFGIDEGQIDHWESALGLSIPRDEDGNRRFSPHHVNLFKNVKKHLTLGRSLDEIRQLVHLPEDAQALPMEGATASRPRPGVSLDLRETSQGLTPQAPLSTRPPAQTQQTSQQFSNANARMQEIVSQLSRPATADKEPPQPASPERQAQQMPERANTAMPPQQAPTASMAMLAPSTPGTEWRALELVDRLLAEKDTLQKRLLETEKLNSHLYNANQLFHKKVKQLSDQLLGLREKFNEGEHVRLMDDKAKLQKQVLMLEKQQQMKQEELDGRHREIGELNQRIESLNLEMRDMRQKFDPTRYCGEWAETATLDEVVYDNFGIQLEQERKRVFKIGEAPTHLYGHTAVLTTRYAYESNSLWQRIETAVLVHMNDRRLTGELFIDYVLDGVPVARAVYRINCERQRSEQ